MEFFADAQHTSAFQAADLEVRATPRGLRSWALPGCGEMSWSVSQPRSRGRYARAVEAR